jgi:hypothetical protein
MGGQWGGRGCVSYSDGVKCIRAYWSWRRRHNLVLHWLIHSSYYRLFRKSEVITGRGCVGLGGQVQVYLWTDQTTAFLPRRTTPQLTRLSDFQDPTSAPSSSRKSRVCRQEVVWSGGVYKETTCRCSFPPIVLNFYSSDVPHHR